MKKLLTVLLCLGFVGCATLTPSVNMNSISLGMTKAEVIKNLGNPASVSAKTDMEYLKYSGQPCVQDPNCTFNSFCTEYYVRLVNGKVESYGKVGDFDSAKNPAVDINANVNGGSK